MSDRFRKAFRAFLVCGRLDKSAGHIMAQAAKMDNERSIAASKINGTITASTKVSSRGANSNRKVLSTVAKRNSLGSAVTTAVVMTNHRHHHHHHNHHHHHHHRGIRRCRQSCNGRRVALVKSSLCGTKKLSVSAPASMSSISSFRGSINESKPPKNQEQTQQIQVQTYLSTASTTCGSLRARRESGLSSSVSSPLLATHPLEEPLSSAL